MQDLDRFACCLDEMRNTQHVSHYTSIRICRSLLGDIQKAGEMPQAEDTVVNDSELRSGFYYITLVVSVIRQYSMSSRWNYITIICPSKMNEGEVPSVELSREGFLGVPS